MSLAEFSNKLRAAMQQADTGPLVIAAEVIAIAESWHEYKTEAEGLTVTAWLSRELGSQGRALGFFNRRHQAVRTLGEDVRRTLHHEVAVYLLDIPENMRQKVKEELTKAYIKNNSCPLTPGQARPIIYKLLGKEPKPREYSCLRCRKLEAELAKLKGLELPEENVIDSPEEILSGATA